MLRVGVYKTVYFIVIVDGDKTDQGVLKGLVLLIDIFDGTLAMVAVGIEKKKEIHFTGWQIPVGEGAFIKPVKCKIRQGLCRYLCISITCHQHSQNRQSDAHNRILNFDSVIFYARQIPDLQ